MNEYLFIKFKQRMLYFYNILLILENLKKKEIFYFIEKYKFHKI